MNNNELAIEKEMKEAFAYFIDRGFSYRYFYEKGGDSSCVYIYRFQKGKNFFDLREVSGGNELNFVVFANGEYQFTDALDIISRERGAYALEFEGIRYDMGDRLGFLKANVEFGLRDESLSEQFKEYLLNLFK